LNRILVIQTAFIGDVILATPVLEALHAHFPNAKLDFLVRKGNESLLTNHPFINELLVWNKTSSKYQNLFSLLNRIRKNKYDLVINCQRFAASGILAGFSGAKQVIGFDKNPFSRLFTKRIPHQIGNGLHETERNLKLLEPIGVSGAIQPKLYPPALTRSFDKPYICIAPASVWFTKQWPAHKWIELIARIPLNTTIYLTGAPGDFELCEKIRNNSTRSFIENLCGKLTLLESAALFKEADMNYVNDSAPMHLCSAVNAPVTALFCSTIPEFGFGPLSDNSRVIETQPKLDCRPCGLHGYKACPKGHFKCAESIEVGAVLT
jgi:heptosyltransferase-2